MVQNGAVSLFDVLFGKPLATDEEHGERVGMAAGIPIFGLDALSSAAYGPEAALTLLIPLGAVGIAYILPISVSIVILLGIVYFSYRQTIDAYPGGGGSYTVASENLGMNAGLLAAAALMIDYVLTAAVGISSGVGALISALPELQPHTLALCLGILLILTVVNLRGVREAGGIFMLPTYLFIGSILGVIVVGLAKVLLSGGHPVAVVPPPAAGAATAAVGAWLIVKAFSSGCTAMTGVEAVSNGVKAFEEPSSKTAKRTLTVIIAILAVMLAGIAYLVRAYGIAATEPGSSSYQSVLSMLISAVMGRGWFYWVSIISILLVLALSANTAFADFPRLCRVIAQNGYMPYAFTLRGRRLVFSQGVYMLSILSALLLIIFGGVTDRLIPLYAVGAFLAFTLSQAGMVQHWRRVGGQKARHSMLVNGFGALATGITVLVVLVAKFTEGAWITMILIPLIIVNMLAVKKHFESVKRQVAETAPLRMDQIREPMIILPVDRWSKITEKGLQYAMSLSKDIRVVHVDYSEQSDDIVRDWPRLVEEPVKAAGRVPPEFVVLKSPFRFVVTPIVDYVLDVSYTNPERVIAVLVPELVERHWYEYPLHNQRAQALKALLLVRGNKMVITMNVPWYLKE
jgi:amino acid transporter